MKKVIRCLLITTASVIALFFILAIALYIPPIQNYAVRKVTGYVSEKTGMTLRVERVRLAFPLDLAIIGPFAEQKGDTLLDARSIRVDIAMLPLFKQQVNIKGFSVRHCKLDTDGLISNTQIKGFVGALSIESRGVDLKNSTVRVNDASLKDSRVNVILCDTAAQDTTTSKTEWKIAVDNFFVGNSSVNVRMPGDSMRIAANLGTLSVKNGSFDLAQSSYGIKKLALKNSSVKYDIPYMAYEKGLDPNHLYISDLNASLNDILYRNEAISANVKSLKLKEKCGLAVDKLTGKLFVNSTRLSLSDFKIATPYSKFEAAASVNWDALKTNGKGVVILQAKGALSYRDLDTSMPGMLTKEAKGVIPQAPLNITADIAGEDGTLKIKTVSLQAKNRFSLTASGTVTGITEPGRKGNLKYSLKIQNTRFLNSLTGESVNIPYGTSAQGNVSFVRDRYSTNSTLRALKGRVNINGSYNTGNESYTAKIKSQQFPLGTILKIDSLHNLTAQFNIKGRGTDVFSKSTTLHAEAEIEKFGISGYDLSNINLQADLKRGKGDLTFTSENDFLNGEGTITAQLNKKDVAATTRLNINKLDMRQFTGKADTLFIATNISAKVNSNNTMTAYRIIADFNDTKIIAKNNTYPTKDLHLSFGSRKDTLYAALAAGDLDMFLVADGNIEKVGGQLSKLADCFTQQAENKAINQNELRKLLPNTELYINAGTDNPISNMLRYSSGYKFDRLRFRLATDTIKGINGSGHLCAFNIGSMLLDTIDIKIFQDTTGMKINGAVHNVSKKNPYIFKAMLNGYINNDAAGAELIYIDKENKEGVNFGVKASFVDSGVKVHLYPETLVIAYRNFKVNRNNYITLKKNKNILADLDLLADDGTGINLHSSVKDSINDITLKANHINLKELTSTIPYLPAISGFLSSDIHVINKNQEITAAYEVNVKKLGYEDVPIGDLGMDGTYIPFERKGSHGIDAFITRDGNEIAEINGTYFGIEDSLAAKLSLLDFPIEMLNGFTGEMFGLRGNLEGELNVSGTSSKPLLNGTVKLDSVHVYSDIYGFDFNAQNDSARIINSNMQMKDLRFYSAGKSPLVINGGIDFSDFDHVPINIRVNASNFELINSEQTKKSQVYGKVFSDINTSIQGTVDNLHIRGNLNVLPKTNVSYVLQDSPLSVENRLNELVSFVDFSDTISTEESKFEAGGVDMTLAISISDAARLHCDISSDKQSYVDIEGGGELTFRYTQQGEIILTGRYTASSGEMKYALPVIPLRTFYLTNGSYIEFTGNPMNPTLNIQAKERIKASVTENEVSRSVAFDAGISITQPLSRMGLQFTLEAPEDQTIQNQLAAMSAEQRNKLAISMLATGMYLEESNTSSGFKANNALNAFLQSEVQQIAGNALRTIDLSVNVEDGTNENGETNTDYSFRFAKRFWGDRVNVIIGGRVSTGEDARNNAASFIDNVSLEYRLDNSASRYIRLFYDHNKHDPLEGQLTEMGAGLVLRRKTDTFGEIFLWKRNKNKKDGKRPNSDQDTGSNASPANIPATNNDSEKRDNK